MKVVTQLAAVMRKEVRQTLRDRRMMAFIVLVPVVQLVVFGYAVNLDIDRVPTVVVDHDDSPTSRRHLQHLFADGTLTEVARLRDEGQAQRWLERGDAAVVLIISAGLDRHLARGETAAVQVVVDGSDPNRGAVAAAAATRYFASANRAPPGVARPAPLVWQTRVLFNPTLETAMYMVPGVAAILLIIITTIVTAMGLAREREVGTLEQILVTPLPSWVVILGKLIPFALIGLLDFGLALATGIWVFGVPLRGDLALLWGATALYLVSTLAMGLLISSVARSQQQAFMAGFAFMLPAVLLSGIMTPIRSMPEWLQPLTLLNPVRYYAEVLRGTLLKGAGPGDQLLQVGALAVFGVVLVVVASMRFRRH